MWEHGIPKVLTWRWAPCAAFVVGSLSFVGFALLAIPDRIGHVDAEGTTTGASLRNNFARTQIGSNPASDFSSDDTSTAAATPSPVARGATHTEAFPKRGFSPPLERPEPPAPPPAPPPPPVVPPPPPAAEPPPPAPPPAEVMPQPQLNIPPPQPDAPPAPGAGSPPSQPPPN